MQINPNIAAIKAYENVYLDANSSQETSDADPVNEEGQTFKEVLVATEEETDSSDS